MRDFPERGHACARACVCVWVQVEYEVELVSWIAVLDVFKDGTIIIKPIFTPPPAAKPV